MPTEAELKLQAKYEAMRKAKVCADTPPLFLRLCQMQYPATVCICVMFIKICLVLCNQRHVIASGVRPVGIVGPGSSAAQ